MNSNLVVTFRTKQKASCEVTPKSYRTLASTRTSLWHSSTTTFKLRSTRPKKLTRLKSNASRKLLRIIKKQLTKLVRKL